VNEHTLRALDRMMRMRILGLTPDINRRDVARRLREGRPLREYERLFLADMTDGKKRPRHRPATTATALKKDEMAQLFFVLKALRPESSAKAKGAVADFYPVSEAYLGKVLRDLDPKRREILETSGRAFAEILTEKPK
jgi:hypothetical protein